MKSFFVNPNEGRLRAGWRILLFLLLFIIISFIGQAMIKAWFGGIPKTSTYLRNSMVIIIAAIAASVAVVVARRYLDKKTFISLGLNLDTQSYKDILFGFLLSGLMVGGFFLVLLATGLVEFERLNWGGTPVGERSFGALASYLSIISLGSIVIFLLMDIVVSWWEELVFRGYLLQNMIEGIHLIGAIIISCLIYGVVHITNPNAGMLSSAIIVLFGFLRIYGYLLTKQLWLSFGMHAGWNFFQGHIFGFAASGQETPSLILLHMQGPDWLTGGAFGPEGSIIVIPFIGVALLLMRWWSKKTKAFNEAGEGLL